MTPAAQLEVLRTSVLPHVMAYVAAVDRLAERCTFDPWTMRIVMLDDGRGIIDEACARHGAVVTYDGSTAWIDAKVEAVALERDRKSEWWPVGAEGGAG